MAKAEESISRRSKIIVDEFDTESDRALVILASAMLDEALERLLRTYLVAVPAPNDSLFDGANAPMHNFSSRIDFAYRLGLISEKLCRDLHIIRRIRNDFAHNVTGCTFQDQSVKNRVFELRKSFSSLQKDRELRSLLPPGDRADFQLSTSFITLYLHGLAENTHPIDQHSLEWLYKPRVKKKDKPKAKQKQ